MINFVNTCFFKPSLLLKSVCILTWELRSSRIILWWNHMKQFLKYNFFQIVRYFWNPFACLLAKYVTGGLFDKRNEGSFFTWGFRLHGYVYPRHCRKRAIVLHCTQHETRLSDSQNDFWIRFRCPTEWLANFQPGVSTQKGRKRVWKLLPSVSGSSIKNGGWLLVVHHWIVFLRNELDTWAIAFLAKPSSTPNRSDLIDWNRMLMKVLLTMCCFGCNKLRIICQGWQPVWI